MEDKRGFSLRQKKSSRRPAISAPKQIPSSSSLAPSIPQDHPRINGHSEKPTVSDRERPTRPGGNTSDLVKRRYSTRFAQFPDVNHADVPPLPNGHPTGQNPKLNLPVPGPVGALNVDIAALKDPNLDPDNYSSTVLSDATDQQLRDYQTSLRKLKNRASTDLQQNVYQNRTQFIKVSKEAERLNDEMRSLRGLISELNSSVSNLAMTSSVPDSRRSVEDVATRNRKQANRSSVANLESIWNSEMQKLWQQVEGAQKYLPAIPGRHIILEQARWVELDAATWKARQKAHMVLLNDHLLIATEKRKRADPNAIINGDTPQKMPTKKVIYKCWPLQDIDVLDLSAMAGGRDRHQMTHAISVRCGHESFTFRSERSSESEQKALLSAFHRATEELQRSKWNDTENVSRTKETMDYYASKDPTLSKKTDLLRSLSNSKDRPEILIDVDGKQKNLRWVESQIDELDMETALQHFEDAVRLVEKLRKLAQGLKSDSMAHELITTKVDGRANKLAGLVVQRLVDTHSFSNATQTNIAWLVRLGFDDRARESFLQARSETITKRSRQCIFEGDLRDYIFQVSFVYFTMIRNTVSIYQQCFPPLMMSACVKWAKENLDGFNVILSRQLSSVQRGSPTWSECMDQAKEQAMLVNEVGLDFKELVRVKSDDSGE
ncbi:MAG: hypothetical protein Q9220_007414 [cf. Caloplaca sp. 1 TL-2023]